MRERDAQQREADHARADEHAEREPVAGPGHAEQHVADDEHDRHLQERVGDRVGRQAGEVGAGRQRRAAQALEDAALAQRREVVGERGERRRHHAHGGDAGDDHVEVLVAAGEHGAEDREQAEREHDAEERRARVAPEHPALQPVLAPRRRPTRAPARGSGRGASSVRLRQLEVDVLEARPRDAQLLEPLAARERLGGQLGQQRRRVLGEALLARCRRRRARRPGSGRRRARPARPRPGSARPGGSRRGRRASAPRPGSAWSARRSCRGRAARG